MKINTLKILALLPCIACTTHAVQTFADDIPKFEITRYQVEGNTLLPETDLKAIVLPFTGPQKDFGDVQKALEALQQAYQKLGYGSVQVVLPEQELKKGVVSFKIIEQKLVNVQVEGNQFHDADNIKRSVPALKSGEIPNTKHITSNLKLANENPSKQTTVLFKENETVENGVDATIKINDVKPSKKFITLDNTGNRQTGHSRLGIGYQNYNVLNRDDRFSAQFLTTLQFPDEMIKMDKVKVFGAGYSIPLYQYGDSVDFFGSYSDVNAGTLLNGALNVTSKGLVLGARYNLNLKKISDYQQKLIFGVDYKAFRPNTDASGTNLTPSATVTPLSLTYQGSWLKQDWQLGYSAGIVVNIPTASHGQASDLGDSPWFSEDDYKRYVFSVDFVKPLIRDWQLHTAFSGQYSGDHLHPGEQFGIGGMDSVRGWHERVFAGDKGYRLSIEATSPDFGGFMGDQVGLKSVLFFDRGWIGNNADILNTKTGTSIGISSIGAGLRMNAGQHFVGRLDYALVIEGDETSNPAATHNQSRGSGDTFGHISLAWLW